MSILALDIGGTKIAAGIVDANGALLQRNRQPTPRDADPEKVWAAAGTAIAAVLGAGPVTGVGISSAGPIDLTAGTISPVNIPAWRGFPVVEKVQAMLPGVPVRLAGDGLCMALGEHWRGAGQGASFLLGMVVIGGGVAQAGPVLFDPLRSALTDYLGLSFIRGLRVLPAALGGEAGLVGAAALLR